MHKANAQKRRLESRLVILLYRLITLLYLLSQERLRTCANGASATKPRPLSKGGVGEGM